jgi:hypothetical protein
MKNLLFGALILISLTSLSQRITETLYKKKISGVNIEMTNTRDETRNDLTLVFLSFQNAKYTTISDIGNITLSDSSELNQFISDLNGAYEYLMTGKKGTTIEYSHKRYSIHLYDFSREIYLYDEKGRRYTILNARSVKSLIEYLSTLKFP